MTIINCDMGESFGLYRMGDDAALMPHISVANVACGFHASDFNHMRATCQLAKTHGVKVGAHPSLPDLQGFGRREMKIGRDELTNCIIYQVGALQGFLKAEGMEMSHIKPHGALYGMAARDEAVAHAVCDAAEIFGLPLMGMINSCHERIYTARGIPFIAEFYADLDYGDDGLVIITREHPELDPAAAAAVCVRAVTEGLTTTISGRDIPVRADAICVHSDTPNAAAIAAAVNDAVTPWLDAA
ncbi:5-oxoprolinase subunit PxpA [Acuticoccus mangrovi]|nr:5-oxoprolinase subunit PxpA [Acuticoccus mangrovi]